MPITIICDLCGRDVTERAMRKAEKIFNPHAMDNLQNDVDFPTKYLGLMMTQILANQKKGEAVCCRACYRILWRKYKKHIISEYGGRWFGFEGDLYPGAIEDWENALGGRLRVAVRRALAENRKRKIDEGQ